MPSLKGKTNPSFKHGYATRGKRPPIYIHFMNIKSRCHIKSNKDYPRYGAKGIVVCDRWRFGEEGKTGFECFLEDMGYPPEGKHSLDRYPNPAGNYEPGNCRWASAQEQANNRKNNRKVTVRGDSKTVAEWSRISGVGPKTIRYRLEQGVPPEEAVFSPVDYNRKFSKEQQNVPNDRPESATDC